MEISVTIRGVTPLLCNRFTDEAAAKATSGRGSVMTGELGTPREQAEPKLYTTEEGVWMVPQPNVFRCLIDAGKHIKNGKSKLTTIKNSLVPSFLDVHGTELKIEAEGWEVDTRPVVIPATGGRILTHRPRFDEWAIPFTFSIDTDLAAEKVVRELFDIAGKRIGLGDFRPDRKGPFGKFRVDAWTVVEEDAAR